MINKEIRSVFSKLNNIFVEKTNISLAPVNKGLFSFLSLYIANENKENTIIVTKDDKEAENIYNISKMYFPTLNTYYLPSNQTPPYQRISPNKIIITQRISTIFGILNSEKSIVITSTLGFMQKTLAKKYLEDNYLNLELTQNISQENILNFLIKNNYEKTSLVSSQGQFATRGDIMDIYSPNIGAFRISFFDNTIERIKTFNPYNQKTIEEIIKVTLLPSAEIILNEETIQNFKYNYKTTFEKDNKNLFELLENKIKPQGIENYLPLFYNESTSIYSLMNSPKIIVWEDFLNSVENIYEDYSSEYNYINNPQNSLTNLFQEEYNILKPQQLLLSKNTISKITSHNFISNYNTPLKQTSEQTSEFININSRNIPSILNTYKEEGKVSPLKATIAFLKDNLPNNKCIIFINTNAFGDSLKLELNANKIPYSFKMSDLNNYNEKLTIILDSSNLISESFSFNKLIILCERETTGIKKTFSNKKPSYDRILNKLSSLQQKDIVVHVKHGLGLYNGIVTLKLQHVEHDFLEIFYKDEEKLYIPVENIDLISKYSSNSEEITLDRLGSNSFEKKQEKIKEKIKNIAYDLIKIAAQRDLQKAPLIETISKDYTDFCSKFPYVETNDQLNAINDIKDDFISGRTADRLICGDVGFGKTEVAMRASFMVANSGYQVAIIAPTTLLCNQHYNNFLERFKDSPIKIAQLSRFVKTKDKKSIKSNLEEGNIDIIIATHTLLAKDIKFKNIGLIIIDEEQNFGVIHKEKLKTIQQNAHIITLSATPIPRTIQLAFKGVKDLSLITTPPVEKLSITTYVLPLDLLAIKNAITKEISRGGQVYYVCQKIADIDMLQEIINTLGLNISYTIIHGQMNSEAIEQNMLDFQNKKYDLLLSTNIIESGLDLKNVNTIIIHKAHMFGLAQLYQLRGRVGRSNVQSYAYLLYDDNIVLTTNAQKRLQVLQSLDYLGASFALASYDLELRGAGNLLGEEQSGHVKEIGFDLYQKLLEKEITFIKRTSKNDNEYKYDSNNYSFSPAINLNIPILIPKNYINDMETSIEMYQKLGIAKSLNDIDDMRNEMIDRFGKIPPQVENLFKSIHVKIAAKEAFVDKITIGPKGVLLSFYQDTFPNVEGLLSYISMNSHKISLKPPNSIMLNLVTEDNTKKIGETLTLLVDLKHILNL